MSDKAMTPQEAATELRHIADVLLILNAKQAALMGAKALQDSIPRVLTLEELEILLSKSVETPLYREFKAETERSSGWFITNWTMVLTKKARDMYNTIMRIWTLPPSAEQSASVPWESGESNA